MIKTNKIPPSELISAFGWLGGVERVESGWLLADTALQLQLSHTTNHPHPLRLWKEKHRGKPVSDLCFIVLFVAFLIIFSW